MVYFRDVQPFVEAIENLKRYYIERGVDIFKDAISGISPILIKFYTASKTTTVGNCITIDILYSRYSNIQ